VTVGELTQVSAFVSKKGTVCQKPFNQRRNVWGEAGKKGVGYSVYLGGPSEDKRFAFMNLGADGPGKGKKEFIKSDEKKKYIC